MVTCPTEQNLITAMNLGTPEKVPNFVQSLMGNITREWKKTYGHTVKKEDRVMTSIGDFTVYKNFGYDSHWAGAPSASIHPDRKLRRHLLKRTLEINKKADRTYFITQLGAIRAKNRVTNWFVEPGIRNEKELRFYLDHLHIKKPGSNKINRYKKGREMCMKKDFVPFASSNVIVEPGNQSLSFGLTAKLMRKKPELLHEFYDLLTSKAELSFNAAVKAGYKCFCTPDDCAYKTGPMFSPKNYRTFMMPYLKRLCDIVRDSNGVIFMHTDGFIDPIMDCFIDAGYHAIQPLEPTSGMTIERVKRKWGDKLACIGNVDTTNTLSFGTPDDARKYVHRCFKEARGDSNEVSGYVFAASGSLHDKVKLENAQAMLDEYRKIRDEIVPI